MNFTNKLKAELVSLLRVKSVNTLIFKLRFWYFVYIKRQLKTYQDEGNVLSHNYSLEMLKKGRTSHRPLKLILPLSVIEATKKDGDTLSIGCRFETELLYLAGYGFTPSKIRGLDMISYSPWVDVGNMHSLPYEDNSMDSVILGWTISYSDNPQKAADEIVRVLRPGGMVAIGFAYYPEEVLKTLAAEKRNVVPLETRLNDPDDMIPLFQKNIDKVYFKHQAPRHREGTNSIIFSINK